MTSDGETTAAEKRLRWRCRRGARELDLLLVRYLDEDFPNASAEARRGFADLLECQDPDLLDWLTGRRSDYPAQCAAVIDTLRSYSD